jgi:hypothetical protein
MAAIHRSIRLPTPGWKSSTIGALLAIAARTDFISRRPLRWLAWSCARRFTSCRATRNAGPRRRWLDRDAVEVRALVRALVRGFAIGDGGREIISDTLTNQAGSSRISPSRGSAFPSGDFGETDRRSTDIISTPPT